MEIDRNKKYLMLVESPKKSKKITEIFKDAGFKNILVLPTMGHFDVIGDGGGYYNSGIELNESLSINYKVDPEKKKNVENLKAQVKAADVILIASDCDREGEAIAQACIDFLKIPKSKYKRVTYQAINQKAIFEGIEKATSINENLVKAARTRGALDKVFGYGVSDQLRKNNKGKSGGRVQSTVLKMMVDREKEILNFIPEKYIDLYLHFVKNNVEFKAKYFGVRDDKVKLTSDKEVKNIFSDCAGYPFIVESIEHKDRFDNPKPPFCTATFQQECATKLGLTVGQAQSCAQQLFDSGKISYHRTDSEIFSDEYVEELLSFVKNNFSNKYISGKVVKGKNDENSQEAHEAIHVLDLDLTPDLFTKETDNDLLIKVYRIIYNRTLATALSPAIISQTTYNIYNNKKHRFVLNSNELKFDGYRSIYAYKEDGDDKDPIIRETFNEGEKLNECSFESVPKETLPPARYKEASLVSDMKKLGIGRPSTYSSIVDLIKSESRSYCTLENKYLKPTQLGIDNIDFLDKNFSEVVNVEYTREMEKSLDLIAEGKLDYITFLRTFFSDLDVIIKKLSPDIDINNEKCPLCGSSMVVRKGRYGMFLGCSTYPKCNGMKSLNRKK